MTDDLDAALQEIDGVGPKTSEKIRDIVEDQDAARAHLEEALAYHEAGDTDYAMKFVRRALNEL